MLTNKETYKVNAGGVIIGGGADISLQTMWKYPVSVLDREGFETVIKGLEELKAAGCDIIRFAAPDIRSAEILSEIALKSPLPVVADIHFDYKIALKCLEDNSGIAKIRINPGNIGAEWKVEEVLKRASERNIPIRVGVNGGSLPAELKNEKNKAEAMIRAAEMEIEIFEKYSFRNAVFSLKSSDVETTVEANTEFASRYRYPLHIGVTEAGPLVPGIVKNTAGILQMLNRGIGATVRVSLSSPPADEIEAGKAILKLCGSKKNYVNIVSCPRCGRATFDVHSFLSKISKKLNTIQKPVTVAVMGCIVNGPDEAKDADIGITGSGKSVVIFRKGEIIIKTTEDKAEEEFWKEMENI